MSMTEKTPIYITTTLPYVNANPHIGFALEFAQADSLARLYRALGHEVFFNTGTDEHGQKVLTKARDEGEGVKEYTDKYAGRFIELTKILGISNDAFTRTTSPEHEKAAKELWVRTDRNGDVYKKKYSGLYCVGCEAFVLPGDLIDGKCPNHPMTEPEFLEEENYFFRLTKYKDDLLKYLEKDGVTRPDFRGNEAIQFVKGGLEDISISRLKTKMPWGIEVPGDDEHVMYVWFDALTNYISTLGWPDGEKFGKFWQNGHTIQVAGKDQVRFQSIIWQTMLISLGIKPTDEIFYHGFITSKGQKMSKSIGNVVDPFDIQKEYGTDALRYYLLRHIHPYEDSDFTDEKFKESYNAHLANGIGNLTSRIMKIVSDYGVDYDILEKEKVWSSKDSRQYVEYLKQYEFNKALDWLWAVISELDEFIAKEEPFKIVKTDVARAKNIVKKAVLKLFEIAVLLEVVLPETSRKILKAIEDKTKPDNLFVRV